MYMSGMTIRGFRASGHHELVVRPPGRFTVLVGANGVGKTTFSDAAYLAHPELPEATETVCCGSWRG
jgi:putative ATP-dependent endonuclease of the OLD family